MTEAQHLPQHIIPPSRKVTDEQRDSVEYRCKRLKGLVCLYCRALKWSIHRAEDWQLGVDRHEFYLGEMELRLLFIETISLLANTEWGRIPDHVYVAMKNPPPPTGLFYLSSVALDDNGQALQAVAIDGESLAFKGNDLVKQVYFIDGNEFIPWTEICNYLEDAFDGIRQVGKLAYSDGPLFEDIECNSHLQDYLEGKSVQRVLGSVEKHQTNLLNLARRIINVELLERPGKKKESSGPQEEAVPEPDAGQSEDMGVIHQRWKFEKQWKIDHPNYNPLKEAVAMREAYAIEYPDDDAVKQKDFQDARARAKKKNWK